MGAMNRSIDRFPWSRNVTLREVVEVVVVTRMQVLAAVGNVVVEVTVAAGNAGGVFRLTCVCVELGANRRQEVG